MACNNCSDSNSVIAIQGITTIVQDCCNPCSNCQSGSIVDSSCVLYSGAPLPCTAIATNTSLEDVLVAFDQALCAAVGDYSTYNTACLAPISTQQEFVEAVSAHTCAVRSDFNYFVDVTFVNYEEYNDTRFVAVNNPGITCSSAGVGSGDSLVTVLNKYCAKFGQLDSNLNISGVNFASCFTVSSVPVTMAQAFTTVISQICQVKAIASSGAGALPLFNNIGSCLPSPGANDSLVDTINKIKTRLCQSPVFDINALTWNCVTKPDSTTTDLQGAFQAILAKLDVISQNFPTFSGDFSEAPTGSNPCQGKTISLSSSPYVDKFVAATPSDSSPGTLQDKLTAGTNFSLDYTTTPGQVILNATGGAASDEKVKSDGTDPSAGYLVAKINGIVGTYGITISTNLNTITHQVDISASLDPLAFITAMYDAASTNPDVLAKWCAINALCPSPCASPSNVQVTYISGTTSTTTTTTTTAAP